MAYVDLAATEARGRYSPPNGNEPQILPDLWRESFPDGPIRTDLPDLTNEELNALGWKGPIAIPNNISYFTHSYQWNNETREYDVTELSEYEKQNVMPTNLSYFTHSYQWNNETREYDVTELSEYEKQRRIQYQRFWDALITTGAYTKIKATASQSLLANTLVTEFIALMSDAKNGHANIKKIQKVLLEILENITFTAEELAEIQTAFTQSGMFAIYTLE